MSVGIIVYTFLGYPVLICTLARFFRRPVRKGDITPSMSLVIPAYNEEGVIASKIQNSLALDYPQECLVIVVVSDGSDDATPEIVARFADQGVRLYHQPCRRGKAAAINRVVPQLDSEIVVFSDANALLDRATLRAIARNFADPAVGGVGGEKRVVTGGEGLYWRYESRLKRCDSSLTSVMGAAGELFAVRREAFQPPEEDSIIEDFVMSLRLVEAGWRVVYEPEAVAREEAVFSQWGDWHRRTRIAAGGFQSMQRLPGLLSPAMGLVAWQYLSHRVLRWALTPFLLPMAYLLNSLLALVSPFYRLLWALQTLFYGLALVGYSQTRRGVRRGLPYGAFFFCLANAAALVGLWRYAGKAQQVTWTKVR